MMFRAKKKKIIKLGSGAGRSIGARTEMLVKASRKVFSKKVMFD